MQVESVAWVTELKSILMCFFFLLTLLAWIGFVEGKPGRRWNFYALGLVFYALALASKTTACTLPAALLLILWLKGGTISRQRLAPIVPFVVLGVGMGLLTVWWERHHQGTQGQPFAMGVTERILIASRAVWFYAGKLFWPVNLTFSYPRWTISASDPLDYLWLVVTVCLGAAIYCTRRYVGRSAGVAVLFFISTLSPVLGFIMLYTFLYSFVADHYQYVACLGLVALVATGITVMFGLLGKRMPFLKPVFCGALILSLGVLTWRQCGMYANLETLWQTTILRNPHSWLAQNNLGEVLLQKGSVNEAISHYQQALKIKPDYGDAHYNLGNALMRKGSVGEAISHYQQALQINPADADAHYNLGIALLQNGDIDEAMVHYRQALQINPRHAEAHNNLGIALFQKGSFDDAIAEFQQAIQIKPDYAEAHNNLGYTLLQKLRVDEAMAQFQAALRIKPDYAEARNNLGLAHQQTGNFAEAIACYRQALQTKPDYTEAADNLAWMLATAPQASLRNGDQSLELARRANQLAGGNNPLTLRILAAAFAETGRFDDAIESGRKAVELARAAGQTGLAKQISDELKLYAAGFPFRENGK